MRDPCGNARYHILSALLVVISNAEVLVPLHYIAFTEHFSTISFFDSKLRSNYSLYICKAYYYQIITTFLTCWPVSVCSRECGFHTPHEILHTYCPMLTMLGWTGRLQHQRNCRRRYSATITIWSRNATGI